jgi:hypothetical protein
LKRTLNVVGKEGKMLGKKDGKAITRNAARVAEIALKVLCNLRLINLCGPFRRCASAMR